MGITSGKNSFFERDLLISYHERITDVALFKEIKSDLLMVAILKKSRAIRLRWFFLKSDKSDSLTVAHIKEREEGFAHGRSFLKSLFKMRDFERKSNE